MWCVCEVMWCICEVMWCVCEVMWCVCEVMWCICEVMWCNCEVMWCICEVMWCVCDADRGELVCRCHSWQLGTWWGHQALEAGFSSSCLLPVLLSSRKVLVLKDLRGPMDHVNLKSLSLFSDHKSLSLFLDHGSRNLYIFQKISHFHCNPVLLSSRKVLVLESSRGPIYNSLSLWLSVTVLYCKLWMRFLLTIYSDRCFCWYVSVAEDARASHGDST